MEIPVLIITYNRFDFVLNILQVLNKHQLKRVFISIDHFNRQPGSFAEVEEFLKLHNFDYKLLKWDENVGMENNIVKGSKWFFEHVQSGVVLEDDCMPTEALFSFLKSLNSLKLESENILLFSTNTTHVENDAFYLQPSDVPFAWGWYANRTFFNSFYDFYFNNRLSVRQFFAFLKANLKLRTKLLCLINYLSFNHFDKNTPCSWDSVLLYYQILKKEPFLVPSKSLIFNTGFGDEERSTHTLNEPAWYSKLKFQRTPLTDIKQKEYDSGRSDEFLDKFYQEYSKNNFRLLLTLFKAYLIHRRNTKKNGA